MPAQRWPARLWLVRHGQSAGNVARDAADAVGAQRIELSGRDVDVPLSPFGEEQARGLGRWFAGDAVEARPEVVLVSPYLRARQTAELFRGSGGCAADLPLCLDERLREKEFGILDGLTTAGIRALQAEQAEFRRLLGKFYHRPPGGESWCDVIFRLRSCMDTIALHHGGKRVMIVAHQVVVLCMRYVIEGMSEDEILAIDKAGDVANCSVTEYAFEPSETGDGKLSLVRYNAVAAVEESAAPVTSAPDAAVAARG
ncbi:histidine phosphatase family protein [Sphingomonas sp.]|jgi:broad specificity phosphatase PhoE|uniref:histidine phosphatase family protein n=1 Tax=Sphingomonas sp. TaxID=28214 RepID=UPI002D802BB8|nr:histidine phosphatase family protein [Sphingomonas sp.]HEU0043704.1 histidine phosphatase family protein [Sphingomonas sp.]